ncbi:MAG TPA: hypothetical protein VGE52_21080, partial [Pirellulales bacterium]
MGRWFGVAAGVGVHALFALTVWHLFWFLKGARAPSIPLSFEWAVVDFLLALQFAVSHSVLLYPPVRAYLTKTLIPGPFYGLFFCAATCVSLLLTFACWRAAPVVIWELQATARIAMHVAFGAAWVALLYSLNLTGLGWQTGLTPWLAWVRGEKPPRREFRPTGAYRVLRHPVYLSFLALVWFTPDMTLDHALLTGLWTAYLFYGSWLKDQRLGAAIGAPYRRYMADVPAYVAWPSWRFAKEP